MPNTSKRTIIEITLAVIGLAILCFLALTFLPQHQVKVYDCSISEISPDYPLEVKESCRKLRAENFRNNLQKPK